MQIDYKNVQRVFWFFVLPSIGALLVDGFYKIIDGLFIGNYAGADGLSAMNMSWPFSGVTSGLGLMLGVGIGAAVSVESGRCDEEKRRRYFAQGFWLFTLFSIFAAGMFYYIAEPALRMQGAEGNVLRMGREYTRLMVFIAPVVIARVAAPLILRNLGVPYFTTVAIVAGACVNILADYIFIVRYGLELKGAAFATLAGESVTVFLCFAYLIYVKPVKPALRDFKLKLSYCLDGMSVGLSGLIRYIYVCMVVLLYNKSLMVYGGNYYVTSYSIIGYAVTFMTIITEGVNNGMQPLISHYYGAVDQKSIRYVMKAGLFLLFVIVGVLNIFILLFPGYIVNMFNKSPELYGIASHALRLNLGFMSLDVLIFTGIMYFQAVKSGNKATFISIFYMLVRLPFLFILPLFLNTDGIWISTPLSSILTCVLVVFFYRRHNKKFNESHI